MEKKKTFKERYPNHRTETRNEKIIQMLPAPGWWKVNFYDDDCITIEAVMFFATVSYEEREAWERGETPWRQEQVVHATGNNEEWFMEHLFASTASYTDERLFYDPDFRLTRDEQNAGEKWINELKLKNLKHKELEVKE